MTDLYVVTFERDGDDAETAEAHGRTGRAQLAAELQAAADNGLLNGRFDVEEQFPTSLVVGFVQGVIDTDCTTLDAIDVAGIVNAMMRGDKYMLDACDPILAWARETFGEVFVARVFEVRGVSPQEVWRALSGEERRAYRAGEIGGMASRSYVVKTYGESFHESRPWSKLVALCDAWARGEEDDGSEEEAPAPCSEHIHASDPNCEACKGERP